MFRLLQGLNGLGKETSAVTQSGTVGTLEVIAQRKPFHWALFWWFGLGGIFPILPVMA